MDHSTYQKLFEKLPQPFTITSAQIRSAYQSLYDKILDSYSNSNFQKLNIILTDSEYTAEILKFKIPPLENKEIKDTLLIDFVKLLYKIITIYPVKYYAAQISAASFLSTFLDIHRTVPNLILDWKPFYKVTKFFFTNPEAQEVFGHFLNSTNLQDYENGILSDLTNFLNLSLQISKYFPDEYEIEVDGKKVKTNTTEQLVKKFFTRISPNGSYTPIYLKFFAHLCPPTKNRYKLYIDYLLLELRDTSNLQCLDSILMLIERLILCNIEDDFTFLIPIIIQFISLHIIKQVTLDYTNLDDLDDDSFFANHDTSISRRLSSISISLFFSPSTRESILDRFESLFVTFKSLCHPSISEMKADRIISFTRSIVYSLQKGIKMMSNEKSDKIFYNLRKEMQPTKDEIHRLLSKVCEMNILLIRMMDFNIMTQPIVIETTIDPLIIDRYFDFAYQCINLSDASGVAYNGWIVLSALVFQIEKSAKLRDNFETIFESAACSLFREDIGLIISHFFSAVFSKIPFNKEKTVKGCEQFNFSRLANLLVSNLMTLFRTLPSLNEKTSQINPELLTNIGLFFVTMVQNCDSDVMSELLPIFTSLATDNEMTASVYHIEPIIVDYCLYANKEQTEKVIKSIKEQLLLPHHNHSKFRYLSLIYSTVSLTKMESIDEVKETTNLLHKFTNDENRKIRKHAWRAISFSLSFYQSLHNLQVTLKPDKMIDNPLENAKLEYFDIKWNECPDTSELATTIFDPIFDKMMTIKDPHEMNELLKEVGKSIGIIIKSIPEVTEGSINKEVSYALVDSLHDLSQLHKKSVPFKDKFLKCALRIIKDFQEHENTMIRIIGICKSLFISFKYLTITPSNYSMKLLFNFFPFIDHKKSYFNRQYIYTGLNTLLSNRKKQIIVPITADINKLFTYMVELGTSNYRGIRLSCSDLLSDVTDIYPPLFEPIIENLINKASEIPIDEFLDFLTFYSIIYTLSEKDKLLCRTMLLLSNNLDIKDNSSLIKLKDFMNNICVFQLSNDTPKSDKKEYIELLKEIEDNYLKSKKITRTENLTITLVIFMCLKHVYDVSQKIFEYLMSNVTHFDRDISIAAAASLTTILRRRSKMTKEKVEIRSNPSIASFPNVLDQVTVKFPENGVYFPLEMRNSDSIENDQPPQIEPENKSDKDEEEEEEEEDLIQYDDIEIDDDELEAELNALDTNSINICPTINNSHKLKETVTKIFQSFEKVEIEWKVDDETKIFDSMLYADMSNGHFIFKDHFNHKKFDFFRDDFLIKSIPGIFSSASNGINDDQLETTVPYVYIWEMYSITVGSACIEKMKEISIKHLSDPNRVEVVSKVLCDMLKGTMKYILYWKIEDRIKFIKNVVLPVLCIISANPNTSTYAETLIFDTINTLNPISISPLIKVLYELSPSGPNTPIYVRSLLSIISSIICVKPINFFNSIDQIKTKYINPFINQINEYSTTSISDILCLIFTFVDIVSMSNTNSPLYSEKIDLKKEEVLKTVEEIIEACQNKKDKNDADNDSLKKILVKTIITSVAFCVSAPYDVGLLCVPLFYKHLNIIFSLLNTSNSQDEEVFISVASDFIKNPIFIINTQMELEFVTNLIKEMMNLSLPMQLILLESLNEMFEANICNIPKSDYPKYEELLLNYGRFEKNMNLGNETRMKIAKILGVFEIRNCTLNSDVLRNKNIDDDLVNDEVLKAASIILNAFLFDKVDERVKKAFNLLEETVTAKRSKERDFFKFVSEIFIHRHSEHVLPDVEEDIIQYRGVVTPDYIC